jgi:multicomponent Na+:H+ antiporter subunit G
MIDVIAGAMLIVGGLLAITAGLGLQRFQDVFARMHAATKPATLGLALVLFGAALLVPDVASRTKLLLVVALQFITAPLGSHLVGRAAYRAGTELSPDTEVDELRGAS